jgi:hypothetical protein
MLLQPGLLEAVWMLLSMLVGNLIESSLILRIYINGTVVLLGGSID